MKERLQKYLARAGIASRRKCEEYIREGKVSVNGSVVTQLGTTIDTKKDTVTFQGKEIRPPKKPVYLKMNKPKDYITSANDPRNRRTVYDLIPPMPERVFAVGRLDRNTTGLLLFTNDGELAQVLTHPRKKIPKTYRVTVDKRITNRHIKQFEEGVVLEDGVTMPAQVLVELIEHDRSIFLLTIYEGRNRQVRRMCTALGYNVLSLKRIQFGPIQLDNLPLGHVKSLTSAEVRSLRDLGS